MSSTYLVNCPHVGCHWFGNLPASAETDPPTGSATNVTIATFQCPCCQQPWCGRIIGDDVEALPIDNADDDLDSVMWPPINIGVGD